VRALIYLTLSEPLSCRENAEGVREFQPRGNALGAQMKSNQGTLKEFPNVELVTVVKG
jgi:hypothetical protein